MAIVRRKPLRYLLFCRRALLDKKSDFGKEVRISIASSSSTFYNGEQVEAVSASDGDNSRSEYGWCFYETSLCM